MKPNHSMLPRRPGFTVIEMMVTIAIIAILSAVAIPTYLDRIVRQQIESALPLADIAKRPIAASWAVTQTFPSDNTAAGLPVAEKIVNNYVSAMSVQDGAINITFGNRAVSTLSGKILTLRPAVVEDAPVVPVAWVCGPADVPSKMTAKGVNQTTVPNVYMPLDCRSHSR